MTRAEASVVVSLVRQGHAAQVRADADYHHELWLQATLLVSLLVAEVLHVHARLFSYKKSYKNTQNKKR